MIHAMLIQKKLHIFKINGYKYVPHNNLDQLAAAVSAQPLSVSVSVGSEWQFYTGTYYYKIVFF